MPLVFRRFIVCIKTVSLLFLLALSPLCAQELEMEGKNGDASAQFLLGIMYLDGSRVTRNAKTGETWLVRAAEQGNRYARYMLAALYADGKTLKQDYKKAFYWGKILAESGHRFSQYGISVLYDNGQGVEKNPLEARKWLESAVKLGSPSAIMRMDALDSATQIRELSDPARYPELLKKATTSNDAMTQYWFGHAFLTGHGLKKDENQAWTWLKRAADQGNAFAQYDLSSLYPMGEGIRPEYQSALSLIQLAAASGHVKAMFRLAEMYEKGIGVMQNWNEAYRLYIVNAGVGNADAITRLRNLESLCKKPSHSQCERFQPERIAAVADAESLYRIALTLMDGDGITQSYGQSLRWLRLAAGKGHAKSQFLMGEIYQNGLGEERNRRMARYWYEIAAQSGDPDAEKRVGTER